MEQDIAELKEDMAAKDILIGNLGTAMHKTELAVQKIDEAIRGNGKEALNSVVKRMDATLASLTGSIPASIAAAIERLGLELENKFSTAKMKAITQEQIEAYSEKPGGWQEFRKTWLFPVMMMIVSALVSAGLTYLVITKP